VALQGLDFEAARGEFVALVGPSGSGKSTLLSALGGLDRPDAGRLTVGGQDLLALSPAQLSAYRRAQVGFVWQQTARNLLPYLSARRNVELLRALGGPGAAGRPEPGELLAAVGMAEHADRTLERLSGGQQQRVALACALANGPAILLGDEPTGEVDWPTARRILDLLGELRLRYGLTVIIVTHDMRVAQAADRAVAIRDGRASGEWAGGDGPRPSGELAVVDSAGRLQLPAELRALAGIGRRARVELRGGALALAAVAGDGAGGSQDEAKPPPAAGLATALYSTRGPTP
jgi:peptide/nickel transport system ATP-binding protein